VNYFTQSGQIRHAAVWILLLGRVPLALNAQRPPITGVPGPLIELGEYH